jgi:hypothetical protein
MVLEFVELSPWSIEGVVLGAGVIATDVARTAACELTIVPYPSSDEAKRSCVKYVGE